MEKITVLGFSDLKNWQYDSHERALSVFRSTCRLMKDRDWKALCAVADKAADARTFFELFFRPVLIEDGGPALFTGYFEPELSGSLTPTSRFRFPIYRLPPELRGGGGFATRAEIEENDLLSGRGLEIAWVDDAVEAFFLQVQGSGRIRLTNGRMIRVGYAGANGHPYRSIGQELARQGIFEPYQVSADVIASWVRRQGEVGLQFLRHNPSFVFFREVKRVPPESGPLGAMNRSITTMRSVAVDPEFVPLGAPVWVEKGGNDAFQRLMIAQDTGSAIKGAQRADIFYGTGDDAGRTAGRVKDGGRMLVLMPIQRAFALAEASGGAG